MDLLIVFCTYMILFYSVYKVVFWFKGRKKNNNLYKISEIYFMEQTFKIDVKKIGIDKLLNIIALSNSFIFTVVLMGTIMIDNFIIRLLIMFVLLIPLIYLVYYGVSRYLKRKGIK